MAEQDGLLEWANSRRTGTPIMVTPSETKHLKLEVSNFGPIAEGTVELRPMTVFVGPSNTGKSYLATLIYALHQFYRSYVTTPGERRTFERGSYDTAVRPSRSLDLSKRDVDCIYSWANRMPLPRESGNQQRSVQYELPAGIIDLVKRVMDHFGRYGGVLDDEIERCFGIDQTSLLTRYASSGTLKFCISSDATELLRYHAFSNPDDPSTEEHQGISSHLPDSVPLAISQETCDAAYRISQMRVDNVETDGAYVILGRVAEDVASHVLSYLTFPAHYLIADRAGVMHAHQIAVRSLIAGASRLGSGQYPHTPLVSGVLGDFLEQLLLLAFRPSSQQSDGNDGLAERLEMRLMSGAVGIERSQFDYPSFVYRPNGWQHDLPLMNTSSMVSELAPVALFLRHVVARGDTLIIEEPESHLHPQAQVEFTRVLAATVKAGIRIIITTHSEWVLEELANLVKLSELPPERRNDIDPDDLALSPDEVGAWLFEPNAEKGGSVVREIPLDEETGTFPSKFGLVSEALYNRWALITNRIERGE